MFFPWFSCGSLHGSLSALKILVTLALALVQVRRACQCVLLWSYCGEEAETCQSIAECPPQPLQDSVSLGPACASKSSPVIVPEAEKSRFLLSFLVIYIQHGLHSIVVCGGLLQCVFQVAQYFWPAQSSHILCIWIHIDYGPEEMREAEL